jgi:hypothetical protein
VASGFWLGAFAWFGGFVWVKQLFGWSALTIGLVVAVFRWRSAPRRWPWHIVFFVGSQLLFVAAVAAGQVFYVGPSSTTEAAHLFGRYAGRPVSSRPNYSFKADGFAAA